MASSESKVKRRALALNELQRLSGLLADSLEIEIPNVRALHRDPELAEIQRIEAINGLLTKAVEPAEADVAPKAEPKPEVKAPAVRATKKAIVKKTGKK